MLKMGLIETEPDQLRNFDRKNIFSNSECCNPKTQ